MTTEAETPTETKNPDPTVKGVAKSTNPQISAGGIVLSTVYHGLFEPLQSISGYIELILDGKVPDPKQRMEFLCISYREAQYLANRFRDLAGRTDSVVMSKLPQDSPFQVVDGVLCAEHPQRGLD